MASDLVIGLGISSAAAEGCFAGSVSFHANLSKINNDFDKNGLNKVVFRDLNSLKKAIINQINGKGISVEECQDYHKLLDPFQDGLAYIRTGSILSQFQTELNKGDDIMVDQSYSERQLFEKAYERILSEFQIVMDLSLEDTKKKLDKALKRNLEIQSPKVEQKTEEPSIISE